MESCVSTHWLGIVSTAMGRLLTYLAVSMQGPRLELRCLCIYCHPRSAYVFIVPCKASKTLRVCHGLLGHVNRPNASMHPTPPPLPAAPAIPADYWENGRLYTGYRKETYVFHCDEVCPLQNIMRHGSPDALLKIRKRRIVRTFSTKSF